MNRGRWRPPPQERVGCVLGALPIPIVEPPSLLREAARKDWARRQELALRSWPMRFRRSTGHAASGLAAKWGVNGAPVAVAGSSQQSTHWG